MNAEQHVARAEEFLGKAEKSAKFRESALALALAHLEAAQTLTKMEEVQATRQAILNAKGQTAGMMDMLSKVLPEGELP